MSILVLQIFVSLCLVAGSVVLYIFTVRARTFEHSDRLALAPLDDDERRALPANLLASPESATPPSEPNRVLKAVSETVSETVRPRERP